MDEVGGLSIGGGFMTFEEKEEEPKRRSRNGEPDDGGSDLAFSGWLLDVEVE